VRNPLPLERLRTALDAWALEVDSIEPITPGVTADVWLIQTGRPLVAKYAYVDQQGFEVGLRAAEVAESAGLRSAAPVRTQHDELTVMVEWPDGVKHPLGLLEFVPGGEFNARQPRAAEALGDTLGRLQAALAKGLPLPERDDPFDYFAYLQMEHDLSDFVGLQDGIDNVVTEIRDLHHAGELTIAPCVWDGPEALVDADGVIGLYDFGFVMNMPVLHGLANRTMVFDSQPDRARFLPRWLQQFPLGESELAHLDVFRRLSVAIYAKFRACHLLPNAPSAEDELSQRQLIQEAIRDLQPAGRARRRAGTPVARDPEIPRP
jgi:Ser/Thr protein kinase RdoA (MazF antagonist)